MTARQTSSTNALRVDALPPDALGLPGRLGMTFAPGKRAPGIDCEWERDLDADLERIAGTYQTSVLVTVLEDDELHRLGISGLPDRARAKGLHVERLAVRDGSVPPDKDLFLALVARVLGYLADGKNVVVHCRGGLGRTGTVVAACLMATGMSADEAIAATRGARPGAIENASQEDFLRSLVVPRALLPVVAVPLSRFRGCMLGGAIGDALGYPVEFTSSSKTILARFGAQPPKKLGYTGKVEITDDTQMALFAAEGILRGLSRFANRGICSMPAVIQRAFLRWYTTQAGGDAVETAGGEPGWLVREPRLHVRRAPGNTCLSSLARQVGAKSLPDLSTPPNNSKGCGAVMRSAPFGLAAATRAEAFELARDSGVITHGHPSGYLSAAYFASLVHDLARGAPLHAAMREADTLLGKEDGFEETAAAVAKARAVIPEGPPTPDAIEKLGGGWVGEEALAIAILCAGTTENATPDATAATLWRSVFHAGDSDSTGSMTGNLLGAMHGLETLPPAWLEELELRDVIDRLAKDLHGATIAGASIDEAAYPPN